jgi:flagellar biogenesis protein FliO
VAEAGVFELFARLVVALAVVIGLMILLARVLKRRGIDLTAGARRATGTRLHVDVLARRALTRNASVAVVRAGNKTLVLGVTDERVTLLSDATDDPVATAAVTTNAVATNTVTTKPDGAPSPTRSAGGRLGAPVDLSEAHRTELPHAADDVPGSPAWKMALDSLRERTVRKS